MKPSVLLIGAAVVVAVALFAFQGTDGPAENAGEAIDEAASDATRAVEDAAD